MSIKDLSENLKGYLYETVDTVKTKASEVELPNLKEAGEKTAERIKSAFAKEDKAAPPNEAAPMQSVTTVSVCATLKLIYFLMAADGEVCRKEEEQFDLMGTALDSDFLKYKEQLMQECQAALEKTIDPEDYYDVLQDGAEKALLDSYDKDVISITPKHLVWNLLSVACSDDKYNDTERRLIKYIVRKLEIDKAVFLEMESSMFTLMDIERELVWIKTTNRPYLMIEAMVNELVDRKNVICESVYDLISL